MDRTVCAHNNRPSECQQCEDEIPAFLRGVDVERVKLVGLHARVRELEAEVQRLEVNGIHSCWDECPRIACVQARHIRELETRLAAQGEELVKLREAAQDALDGWRYIRMYHGDLYGVGWDRVENSLRAALGDG